MFPRSTRMQHIEASKSATIQKFNDSGQKKVVKSDGPLSLTKYIENMLQFARADGQRDIVTKELESIFSKPKQVPKVQQATAQQEKPTHDSKQNERQQQSNQYPRQRHIAPAVSARPQPGERNQIFNDPMPHSQQSGKRKRFLDEDEQQSPRPMVKSISTWG